MGDIKALGHYRDWPKWIQRQVRQHQNSELSMDFMRWSEQIPAKPKGRVEVLREWSDDQTYTQELAWPVGYGPATKGWLVRPINPPGKRLPGVLALHDHSAFKTIGKEKIAKGPGKPDATFADISEDFYDSVSYVNELAAKGYVVLVHDVFLWGSRMFEREAMEGQMHIELDQLGYKPGRSKKSQVDYDNLLAAHHEHAVEKLLKFFGTTLAAVLLYEDRVALSVLGRQRDVDVERLGCVGLSGGGFRSGILYGSDPRISTAVVAGGMYSSGLDMADRIKGHSWMVQPGPTGGINDLPDRVSRRSPHPLLIQYLEDDDLFSLSSMKRADSYFHKHFSGQGQAKQYRGSFYPGPHRFDQVMQVEAFDWFDRWL